MLINHSVGPLRIVVVTDGQPLRHAIRNSLGGVTAFEVVGETADGNSAIEMALRLVPDVIIMAVKLPRLSGAEATRRIKRVLPGVHLVGISSREDSLTKGAMEAMMKAGCSAFIVKECVSTLPEILEKLTGRPIAAGRLIV